MDTAVEQSRQLHRRFKEVQPSSETLVLDRTEIPWLPRDETATIVPLTEVTRIDGSKFLLGSAIRGGQLLGIARHLKGKGPVQFKLFYAAAEQLLDRQFTKVDRVDNPRTKGPGTKNRDIWYTGNGDAVRIYFMDFGEREGKRVIIRVAACQAKGGELGVYKVIGTEGAKANKRRILGK